MDNHKDLPKPEIELNKPEKDLPLPEKELKSGTQNLTSAKKPKKSKSIWIIAIIILAVVVLLAGAGGYLVLGRSSELEAEPTPTPAEQVVCTQEAMLCPDGKTYVTREGPKCEFAKCPAYTPEKAETTPADNETEVENLDEITKEPLPTATPSISTQ